MSLPINRIVFIPKLDFYPSASAMRRENGGKANGAIYMNSAPPSSSSFGGERKAPPHIIFPSGKLRLFAAWRYPSRRGQCMRPSRQKVGEAKLYYSTLVGPTTQLQCQSSFLYFLPFLHALWVFACILPNISKVLTSFPAKSSICSR